MKISYKRQRNFPWGKETLAEFIQYKVKVKRLDVFMFVGGY
jgi:hypothetical protein